MQQREGRFCLHLRILSSSQTILGFTNPVLEKAAIQEQQSKDWPTAADQLLSESFLEREKLKPSLRGLVFFVNFHLGKYLVNGGAANTQNFCRARLVTANCL